MKPTLTEINQNFPNMVGGDWNLEHELYYWDLLGLMDCSGLLDFNGFKMILMDFSHILGRIIPTDELIFFKGVGIPPTSPLFCSVCEKSPLFAGFYTPSTWPDKVKKTAKIQDLGRLWKYGVSGIDQVGKSMEFSYNSTGIVTKNATDQWNCQVDLFLSADDFPWFFHGFSTFRGPVFFWFTPQATKAGMDENTPSDLLVALPKDLSRLGVSPVAALIAAVSTMMLWCFYVFCSLVQKKSVSRAKSVPVC